MTAINVDEQFIGAGKVYIDGVFAGDTMETNVFRVVSERGAPRLNGVRGMLARTDYTTSEMAELEVTLKELSATRLPMMIPGAAVTAQNADGRLTAGGLSTTLAALTAVGATNIKLTALTNLAVGDVVQIGPTGTTREFRKITTVGTVGSGGTGFDLDAPLTNAHANGETVEEVDSTTLAADSALNASNIKVVSVAGLAVGDIIRIGYPTEVDVRKISVVGTAGVGGSGITLEVPLARSHRTGDNVVETTNEGGSLIEASATRRLQAADYHAVELRVPGVGTREIRFGLRQAINTANAEFSAEDSETPLGPRLTFQSRINPDNIEQSPWYIQRIV